jgi:Mn2+/Fe2+ NRAMP family transporter
MPGPPPAEGTESGRFSGLFRFTGPGIILAASSSGWVGLMALLGIGADMGYSLLWVIALVIIFKLMFTSGIARYTVATGHDIFYGLNQIPGPAHWDLWFICIIYILEIFNHGAGAMALAYLIQGFFNISVPPLLMAFGCFLLIGLILFQNSYPLVKKILLCTCAILCLGIIFTIGSLPFSGEDLIGGITPGVINNDVIYFSGILFWSLGTGLSLLCYSSWLRAQIGGRRGKEFYRNNMRAVLFDMILGFAILAAASVLYVAIGAVVMYEHGLAGFESDLMVEIIAHTLNGIPYGREIFLGTGIAALLGYLIGGVDGRSRAVASIIHQATPVRWSEGRTYRIIVVFFILILSLSLLFGDAMIYAQTLVFSIFFFGVVGIMLIWLDRRLPAYARGSPLWYILIGLGSLGYIGVAILYLTI